MKYSKAITKKLYNYFKSNPDDEKEFLSMDYNQQKLYVRLLIALKKI